MTTAPPINKPRPPARCQNCHERPVSTVKEKSIFCDVCIAEIDADMQSLPSGDLGPWGRAEPEHWWLDERDSSHDSVRLGRRES